MKFVEFQMPLDTPVPLAAFTTLLQPWKPLHGHAPDPATNALMETPLPHNHDGPGPVVMMPLEVHGDAPVHAAVMETPHNHNAPNPGPTPPLRAPDPAATTH